MKIPLFFKIKNNKYLKNFLTLFTGSVLGQLVLFVSIPFLTRMFSKEDFGIYALFSSSIFLLKPLISLNYELAIILPKRDKDAINVFAFNVLIILVFSFILFLIIYLFHFKIITFLNIQSLTHFIYFIPFSVFLIAFISALDNWNIRLNSYKHVSIGVITKSTTLSASQLITGISNFKYIGLIPGLIIGQVVSLIYICVYSIKNILSLKKHISIKRMLLLASKYKDIPIFNTLLTFTNNLSSELPILLVTKFYGFSMAGILGLALKVSKTPPGIIGQSFSQIFYNEACNVYNSSKSLYNLVKKTYKTLFITALLVFIPMLIISFYLDFIFGEKWVEVGTYVRILIPLLFISFLNSPISLIITILNKQKTVLMLDIINLFLRFTSIYIGYIVYENVYISISLFSGIGIVYNLILFVYFLKISKKISPFVYNK